MSGVSWSNMGIFSSVNHRHETDEALADCVERNDDHVGVSSGFTAAGIVALVGEAVASAPEGMKETTAAATLGFLGYATVRGARGHEERQQYATSLIERETASRQ
jgi:hypothetical protein